VLVQGGPEVLEQVQEAVVQVEELFGMSAEGDMSHFQSYPMVPGVPVDLVVQAVHPHLLEEAEPL
jgi:hypothetical protein